ERKAPRRTNGQVSSEEEDVRRGGNGHASEEEINTATFDGEGTPLQREIRGYISKSLLRLERYVVRELRLREADGEPQQNRVSEVEVLDEVVVTALSAEEKPAKLPLERWLFRLTLQTIRRLTKH